jgi:hypothetical protein
MASLLTWVHGGILETFRTTSRAAVKVDSFDTAASEPLWCLGIRSLLTPVPPLQQRNCMQPSRTA